MREHKIKNAEKGLTRFSVTPMCEAGGVIPNGGVDKIVILFYVIGGIVTRLAEILRVRYN